MVERQLIDIEPVRDKVREAILSKYDTTTFLNTTKIDLTVDVKNILDEYIKDKDIKQPSIMITPMAYIKMRKLVNDTTTEIGWYGIVEEHPEINTYLINDIIVYPQTVSGATCEQDDDKMFEFEMSLSDYQVNHKRFHGHSHVNMGVTPSSVDENFYQDLLSQVNDYFIITITNKRNDYTVRFYDKVNNIMYSNLPIQVIDEDGALINDWYDDVQDMLSTYKPKYNFSSKPKSNNKSIAKQTSIFDDYEDDFDYIDSDWERSWDEYYNNLYRKDIRNESK